MTLSLRRALAATSVAVLGGLAGSHAAAQNPGPNPAAMMQARQANQAAMREYTWKSRTDVRVKGESRALTLEVVRYDLDGRLQKTPIGGGAEATSKPSAPLGRGGLLQQRLAARKKGQFEDLMEAIAAHAQAYGELPQDRIVSFMQHATMSAGAGAQAGTMRIDGRAILSNDDAMSIWIDRATSEMRRLEVTTTIDGELLQLAVDYRSLPNGLTYPARSVARYPDKELEITTETFEYQHTGAAR